MRFLQLTSNIQSNVLIKDSGQAALCDFGLAQVMDEEFEQLASLTIHRGTVRWTSPERLEDNGPLAPSSDVWSWGWLLWEVRLFPMAKLTSLLIRGLT